MDLTLEVQRVEELPAAAVKLLKAFPNERIFAFYGSMGAGKTTFIRAICDALGVEDVVSSPTFSVVNEYRTNAGDQVYHFDFYRFESEEEAYDIGYEEYVYNGAICLMEWPERIPNLLPDNYVSISISEESNCRTIKVNHVV